MTRERLYLNSVEKVMDSVSKVLIDVEGGNNMMYLPLDKIVSQQATKTEDSQLSNSDLVGQVANEVINRLRTDQSRSRRTEAR